MHILFLRGILFLRTGNAHIKLRGRPCLTELLSTLFSCMHLNRHLLWAVGIVCLHWYGLHMTSSASVCFSKFILKRDENKGLLLSNFFRCTLFISFFFSRKGQKESQLFFVVLELMWWLRLFLQQVSNKKSLGPSAFGCCTESSLINVQ
jgi:Na+/melibiose symporter-like transporter